MPPAKGKRIITDRRREQNKAAQKIYRAKIKSRLKRLEHLQQTTASDEDPHGANEHETIQENSEDLRTRPSNTSIPRGIEKSPMRELTHRAPAPPSHTSQSISPQSFIIRPYTSDPRLNHLNLPHISVISAGIENSLSLHITKEDALTAGFPSPFYNSSLTLNNSTPLPGWWSSIPRDLYPTSLQVSTPHQAWLDSIPIPSFRDGALMYLTLQRMQAPCFDLSELADDIDSGGLVCWGGAGPVLGSGGGGTPWDARSWEAKPWFLIKWRYVTGGLEGDLGRLSSWWWRLRGERV